MHQSGAALLCLVVIFIIIIIVLFALSGSHGHGKRYKDGYGDCPRENKCSRHGYGRCGCRKGGYGDDRNGNGSNGNGNGDNGNGNGGTDVTSYSSVLSGQNEVPPVRTNATGLANVNLFGSTRVRFQVNVAGLKCSPTAAHFHLGPAGENGPVVKTLPEPTLSNGVYTFRGEWTAQDSEEPLTPQLVADLRAGRLYLNVHTTKYPQGEIRAQVLPVD